MIKKKLNKKCIKNLLYNCINKKGKSIKSKNLILNSSVEISENNSNNYFYDLFENIIKNYTIPLKSIKKNKYVYISYTTLYKSLSSLIAHIFKNIKKNKKRISFDFYFTNEIYKLLNYSGNLYSDKQDIINAFNNLSSNIKSKFSNTTIGIKVKDILNEKNMYKYIHKYSFIYYIYRHHKKYENLFSSTIYNIYNKLEVENNFINNIKTI